jgi:4-hydroxymandelate oxidase
MSALTRRRALAAYWSLAAATRSPRAQQLAGEPPGRIPPVEELVNAQEFRAMAERRLDSLTFAEIEGGDRAAFERITFRPRLMVDSRQMDLSTELLGQSLFTPLMVGPIAIQTRYHPEGELAMARGAAAGKAALIVAARSGHPIEKIAAQSKGLLWYQVDLDSDPKESRALIERAIGAGCRALCVTIATGIDWSALDRLRQGFSVPVVLKGVMSPEEAGKAVSQGVQGVVVSNYSPAKIPGIASPIEVLPAVAAAVAGKAVVLMDGGVRRGSDVLKALALGANAVLIARPAVWGLAAYGAAGVQGIVEMIQSEFARDMAMCGRVNIRSLDPGVVRIHQR